MSRLFLFQKLQVSNKPSDEVAKYDIIEQKVYTSRLKIEAKGVHLLLK